MAGRRDGAPELAPVDREDWRRWLTENAASAAGAWVTCARGAGDFTYEEMVREGLCFGWIDSTARKADDGRSMIWMGPRRPGSPWAASNRQRVTELLEQGRMAPAGLALVEQARADGSWTVLMPVEALQVPDDLAAALDGTVGAREAYEALPPSARKQLLWHVVGAKRAETRQRRVDDVVRRVLEGDRLP